MHTTFKKFDMEKVIDRRIRELRGELVPPDDIDEITLYTRRRMGEILQYGDTYPGVDKSLLGCYTVGRMGDRNGET